MGDIDVKKPEFRAELIAVLRRIAAVMELNSAVRSSPSAPIRYWGDGPLLDDELDAPRWLRCDDLGGLRIELGTVNQPPDVTIGAVVESERIRLHPDSEGIAVRRICAAGGSLEAMEIRSKRIPSTGVWREVPRTEWRDSVDNEQRDETGSPDC